MSSFIGSIFVSCHASINFVCNIRCSLCVFFVIFQICKKENDFVDYSKFCFQEFFILKMSHDTLANCKGVPLVLIQLLFI